MKLPSLLIAAATLAVPAPVFAKSGEPSIARLNYAGLRKKGHCTAVLIGKSKVLTARHCVDSWPRDSLRLVFGYDRGEWLEVAKVKSIHKHKRQDLAVLCLHKPSNQAPIGVLRAKDTKQVLQATAIGYPRSRAHAPTSKQCVLDLGKQNAGNTRLRFECPLEPGMSGSPVFAVHKGRRQIAAIASQTSGSFSVVERIKRLPDSDC